MAEEEIKTPERPEEREETTESKIAGKQAMAAQYQRMIAENERQIGLGDDIEARKKFIGVLQNEMDKINKEIAELQAQL